MPNQDKKRRWSTGVADRVDARVFLALGAFMMAMTIFPLFLWPASEWGTAKLVVTPITVAAGAVLLFMAWATYSEANAKGRRQDRL